MSSLHCVLPRAKFCNVTVVKVKITSYYFHLPLSTKNFNFKNSIFLIMPNVMQKNYHSRVWAPYPFSEPIRAPQHSKVSVTQWNFKGAVFSAEK